MHALRYLKPKTGFREVFAYDNITYIVAGELVQAVSGETWEQFVEQHIFAPLGMTDSRTFYDPTAPNAVALHGRTDGPIRGMGRERILTEILDAKAAAPCGSINASAVDMARWMGMWEEGGKLPDGGQLLSAAAVQELWNPVVVIPSDSFGAVSVLLPEPTFQDYALGWFVEDDYGHTVVEHTGAVFGALAALYFIPDRHVAFSVIINSEDGGARRAVVDYLLAHYLGQPQQDWIGNLQRIRRQLIDQTLAQLKNLPQQYKPNDKSSLPMARYAGTYADPWYGTMTVSRRPGNKLWINFDRTPNMHGSSRARRRRHLPRALDRAWDRGCLRDFQGRQRPHHFRSDEAGVTAGRFQLRLPGPSFPSRRAPPLAAQSGDLDTGRMVMFRSARVASSMLVGSTSAFVVAPAARADDAATQQTAATLQEIVVTAQKRQEKLINVPMGVTAITSDTIQSMHLIDFADLETQVPGLSVELEAPRPRPLDHSR